MASTVYFQETLNDLDLLKEELSKHFSAGQSIALKLHMGEAGNQYYLKPDRVKPIVEMMMRLRLKPFLFDSPVKYPGKRATVQDYEKTAAEHGYSEEKIGCPVIISDEHVDVRMPHLTIQVCKPLAEADGMFVVSHLTGHSCSGFGAAIKNIGMGGVTKKSKTAIHEGGGPKLTGDCVACGLCEQYCSFNMITMEDRAVVPERCTIGCSVCITNCPEKALTPHLATFDVLLAEGAAAVVKAVKSAYYMNFLVDISSKCDCCSGKDDMLSPDIGIVFSDDIVATDKAALDLVVDRTGQDIFKKIHHKSPIDHINAAEELGIGSMDYRLNKL